MPSTATAPAAVLAAALALAAAAPVLAQPPGAVATPGGVDPAPGATRPYLGHPGAFEDPMQRLDRIEGRIASLPPREARSARRQLASMRAFAATQRQRHGGQLRDWDRERLTRMMNDFVARCPALRG